MDLVLKRFAMLVSLLVMPGMAWALSFGDITTHSHLNQKLDAEVRLHSQNPTEIIDARISLASREAHERAGITMTPMHNKLRFKIVKKESGEFVVKVATKTPVKEPVVEFVLELNWVAGRIQRPFSVHLNPPR